ncbi:hypothetical protein Syun_007144 [Stephania yunnanensis]|uniref:Uncharacterized protein n=1 Tax=Stephania yunnanensis TaxID=152371 RepID=A0AAP0KZF5_9MAGN
MFSFEPSWGSITSDQMICQKFSMEFFGFMFNLVRNNQHEFWWGKLKVQTQRRKMFRSYISGRIALPPCTDQT